MLLCMTAVQNTHLHVHAYIYTGISIEFEKQEYTVREGEDHNVEVCLNIPSTTEIDFTLFGTISVEGVDAQGIEHVLTFHRLAVVRG